MWRLLVQDMGLEDRQTVTGTFARAGHGAGGWVEGLRCAVRAEGDGRGDHRTVDGERRVQGRDPAEFLRRGLLILLLSAK
jgi:hypothetical protein